MATEFSREFFADNRIVKASLRCAHKLREKDLDRIKSEIKKLYDATEVILTRACFPAMSCRWATACSTIPVVISWIK